MRGENTRVPFTGEPMKAVVLKRTGRGMVDKAKREKGEIAICDRLIERRERF